MTVVGETIIPTAIAVVTVLLVIFALYRLRHRRAAARAAEATRQIAFMETIGVDANNAWDLLATSTPTSAGATTSNQRPSQPLSVATPANDGEQAHEGGTPDPSRAPQEASGPDEAQSSTGQHGPGSLSGFYADPGRRIRPTPTVPAPSTVARVAQQPQLSGDFSQSVKDLAEHLRNTAVAVETAALITARNDNERAARITSAVTAALGSLPLAEVIRNATSTASTPHAPALNKQDAADQNLSG